MKFALSCGTRCEVSCNGHHVNYPESERPKLEGRSVAEIIRRLLATKSWAGSTVEEGVRREVLVPVRNKRNVLIGSQKMMCDVVLLHHPSGAVATIRANL